MPELGRGHYDHWLFQRSENIAFELGVHPLALVQQFCGRVLEAQTVCSNEQLLPSGETFYGRWQVAMNCERATACVLLSVSTGFQDIWMHVQGEDGACHADFRRNTVYLSERSPFLRPNDDLRDSLQTATSIACGGLRHYKNYILSNFQCNALYPGQYASMKGSIEAYYAALRDGYEPPVGIAEGTAVIQACELAVAPIRRQQSWSLQ
jgi:predicted dehydrogenase